MLFNSVGNTSATVTLKDSTDNYGRFDITTNEENGYHASFATTTVSRSWAQKDPRIPVISYDGKIKMGGLTIAGSQITLSGSGGYIVMVVGYRS